MAHSCDQALRQGPLGPDFVVSFPANITTRSTRDLLPPRRRHILNNAFEAKLQTVSEKLAGLFGRGLGEEGEGRTSLNDGIATESNRNVSVRIVTI